MTGEKFEQEFCDILSKAGYWVLQIPRNRSGAQPFDVLAIGDKIVNAYDCKVSRANRFPLERIEPNQWLAFEAIERKTKHHAFAALAILHNGSIYRLSYFEVRMMQREGRKSADLESMEPWIDRQRLLEDFGKELI